MENNNQILEENNYSEFFEELERNEIVISQEQKKRIIEKMDSILNYQPKVGVFGKTGAGKSSLCNALFGKEVADISDIKACTRNPQEIILGIGGGDKGIKLIDVPGVGESESRDAEYAALYKSLLPELDIVLWVLKGDDRAYEPDERFYKHVVKPHIDEGKPFLFVLNQIDKIEPFREWNLEKREPGIKQLKNIIEKKESVSKIFSYPLSKIIEVSANEKYNLIHLVDELIYALPNEKKITVLRGVNKEYVSVGAGDEAIKGIAKSMLSTWGENVGEFFNGYAGAKIGKAIGESVGKYFDKVAHAGKKFLNAIWG